MKSVLAALIVIMVLSGCNSNTTPVHTTTTTSVLDARLYGVSGICSAGFPQSVDVYEGPLSASTSAAGNASIAGGTISDVAVDPTDQSGSIYVSVVPVSIATGEIAKFARPNPNGPTPTLTVPVFAAPEELDFDSNGNLFVLDGNTNAIYTLSHPITSASLPIKVLQTKSPALLQGFTLDASNDLIVLLDTNAGNPAAPVLLDAYAPPYTGAAASTSNLPPQPWGPSFDAAAGLVFVGSTSSSNTAFWTYSTPITPNESPSSMMNVQGKVNVGSLAFDTAGNTFFAYPAPAYPCHGGTIAVAAAPFTGQIAFQFTSPFETHALAIGP
ncbi:MAG: hypothetical protein JO343_02770 [Candidatus Eremiobacteraeota bacterium]|nr:hypothetical protein [Candidatus Eremiobacteraeota bacterium]